MPYSLYRFVLHVLCFVLKPPLVWLDWVEHVQNIQSHFLHNARWGCSTSRCYIEQIKMGIDTVKLWVCSELPKRCEEMGFIASRSSDSILIFNVHTRSISAITCEILRFCDISDPLILWSSDQPHFSQAIYSIKIYGANFGRITYD